MFNIKYGTFGNVCGQQYTSLEIRMYQINNVSWYYFTNSNKLSNCFNFNVFWNIIYD